MSGSLLSVPKPGVEHLSRLDSYSMSGEEVGEHSRSPRWTASRPIWHCFCHRRDIRVVWYRSEDSVPNEPAALLPDKGLSARKKNVQPLKALDVRIHIDTSHQSNQINAGDVRPARNRNRVIK